MGGANDTYLALARRGSTVYRTDRSEKYRKLDARPPTPT